MKRARKALMCVRPSDSGLVSAFVPRGKELSVLAQKDKLTSEEEEDSIMTSGSTKPLPEPGSAGRHAPALTPDRIRGSRGMTPIFMVRS